MVVTKVVNAAQDPHASAQGIILLRQGARATCQRSQPLAKGGIEPFNKGGIDHPAGLGAAQQLFDQGSRALHNAPLNLQVLLAPLLDHLHNLDVGPCHQPGSASFASPARQWRAKGVLEGSHITGQAIDRQQQGTTQGHLADLIGNRLDQLHIPPGANRPTQPQTGRNHHRHRDPNTPLLRFRLDFIGLHLPQIQWVAGHLGLMHPFAMLPRALPPIAHRPFVQSKGFYDGLQGTTIHQQGNHQQHRFRVAMQPVEDAALARHKRLAAFMTDVTLFLLALDTDVAFAFLPSCVTRQIRAKYFLWVHLASSLFQQQDFASEPTFFQPLPTLLWGATLGGIGVLAIAFCGLLIFVVFSLYGTLIQGKAPEHGMQVNFQVKTESGRSPSPEEMQRATKILSERASAFGDKNCSFEVFGTDQIVGRMAQKDEIYLRKLTQTGLLEFVDMGDEYLPEGAKIITDISAQSQSLVNGRVYHTVLTGERLKYVSVGKESEKFVLYIGLDEEGKTLLFEHTKNNIGKYLAVVLDKKIITEPMISTTIPDGQVYIEGNFTHERANDAAVIMRYQALPFQFVVQEVSNY
jgi:hypothetical protein